MKIGEYELFVLTSGDLLLDGGAMHGVVPKTLWEKTSPADEKNRIKLVTRHLLLVSDTKKILIDTGSGVNWDEKFIKIFNIDYSRYSLFTELKKLNINTDEITDVIITHLHFDHIGGAVIFENGKPIPAFSNATYHVQKKQYEWGLNPSERDRASYFKERYVTLNNEGVLKQYDGNFDFDDNISFLEVNGHTPSQQLIKITDSSSTLLYCADLIPLASHIKLPYIMGYDLLPLVTLSEKKKLLKQATDENWHLFFEHDPYLAAATIKLGERGYELDKTFGTL